MGKAKTPKPSEKSDQEDLQPWERLDEESDPAFEAFATYRDMGLKRSTAKVARVLSRSKVLMTRWSSKHGWGLRVRAWDAELDKKAREDRITEVLEMRRRQAQLGRAMQGVAARGLKNLTAKKDSQGKLIEPELSAAEIARLAKTGSILERLSMGEPGEILENRASDPDNAMEREVQRLLDDPEFRKQLDRSGARARGHSVKPRSSRKKNGKSK